MNKEIAIIIPAYNAHDTIERLLFSILNQSVKDLCRVYLIDDYSEKDYFYLIDKFPWLDMVICRLDENCGPGVARNKGLELVIEDNLPYIVFADADDLFLNYDSIYSLYKAIIENNCERVEAIFATEYHDEKEEPFRTQGYDPDVWVFAKIYKTQLIKDNSIFFPKTRANEDVAFNALYLLYCKSNLVINDMVYLWKDTPTSITRTDIIKYSINSLRPLIEGLEQAIKKVNKEKVSFERLKSFVINRTIRLYFEYLNILVDDLRKEYISEWNKDLFYYYEQIYKPFEKNISEKDLLIEWEEVTNGISQYVFASIGYYDFIKKIRAI